MKDSIITLENGGSMHEIDKPIIKLIDDKNTPRIPFVGQRRTRRRSHTREAILTFDASKTQTLKRLNPP